MKIDSRKFPEGEVGHLRGDTLRLTAAWHVSIGPVDCEDDSSSHLIGPAGLEHEGQSGSALRVTTR